MTISSGGPRQNLVRCSISRKRLCRCGGRCWRPHCWWFEHGRDRLERVVNMANYWSKEIVSILGHCAPDVSLIKAVKATAPQVDGMVPSLNDSAAPDLSQVYQEQIDVGQTTQELVGAREVRLRRRHGSCRQRWCLFKKIVLWEWKPPVDRAQERRSLISFEMTGLWESSKWRTDVVSVSLR